MYKNKILDQSDWFTIHEIVSVY